jgi:hypothetical protein
VDGQFHSWKRDDFSLLLSVETGSGAQPASYTMGTE